MTLYPPYTWSALAVSPLFPDVALKPPQEVLDWAQQRFSTLRFYPRSGGATAATFDSPRQNEQRARLSRYVELFGTGLAYFATSCDTAPARPGGSKSLNLLQVSDSLGKDIEDASLFLNWLGMHGQVSIQYWLKGAPDLQLDWPSGRCVLPALRQGQRSLSRTCSHRLSIPVNCYIHLVTATIAQSVQRDKELWRTPRSLPGQGCPLGKRHPFHRSQRESSL